MIEKVNPSHPDKLADRIAGAIVDLAYSKNENAKMACEVLIGHGECHIICETSEKIDLSEAKAIVDRIVRPGLKIGLTVVPQDVHLAGNQKDKIRCGDNGIFKGVPLTKEEKELSRISREIYERYPYDGKYILADNRLIVCQSNCKSEELLDWLKGKYPQYDIMVNPLGDWTGSIDTDSGLTSRKLGSDMASSVTGGGLHGKDLSKSDVSANIYAFDKAQETGKTVELFCAIGDDKICGIDYDDIVKYAKEYIKKLGGFEKLAEWGLF